MAGPELSGSEYLRGKPCPKCDYVRAAADVNPDWQCPGCGLAYAKFAAPRPMAARLARTGRDLAGDAATDHSVYALIAANLAAAAIALYFGMSLRELMLVYWMQSVAIGVSYFIRMASLQDFSTEGMKLNNQPLEAISANKWRIALFFLMHYGFFHLGYLFFIATVADHSGAGETPLPYAGLWVCALVFSVNHAYSLLHNIRRDRQGTPNLGTMMMLPYARIVPMHVTILVGGTFFGGMKAMLAFVVLKILADVFMHTLEHSLLRSEPLLHRID